VERIILVRPAVEAGERLGFLPGDMAQKVDPYLRPLYDALYDLMGYDKVAKMFERQAIEIAPLAFMRGRTLNHAFIILDEAQNTTREQMKMFLTRIGFGRKKCVASPLRFSRPRTWCAIRWCSASSMPMTATEKPPPEPGSESCDPPPCGIPHRRAMRRHRAQRAHTRAHPSVGACGASQ
jgi:hypothetical protein